MATDAVSREAQQQFPRWPITPTRTVRVDLGPAGSGQIVDVSHGGIRVKTVAPLRREAELPLRIEVPDRSAVQCSGVVVWSKPTGAAGLKFTKLADDQKAILGTWLAELEHAASDASPQKDEFARTTAQITAMKLNNADALRLIARRVEHLVTASGVAIALGKTDNMTCLARTGDAPDLGTAIRPGVGLVGECIRGRRMVLCHDTASDPRAGDLNQGSALILPLIVNGELRGVMQVFSAKALAFDAKSVEIVEKLADAAIYVTHNVMPQRRLATVTTLPKATPKPTAPPVSKASDSGKLKAFSAALVKPLEPPAAAPLVSPVTPKVPVAPVKPDPLVDVAEANLTSIADPIGPQIAAASPATTRPFGIARNEPSLRSNLVVSTPLHVYHPRQRNSAVRKLVPVAVVLVATSFGLYLWRHQAAPVSAAVPLTDSAAPSTAFVSTATTIAATPSAVEPIQKPAPQISKISLPSAVAGPAPVTKPLSVTEAAAHEKKAALVEKAPEPAPRLLASGIPVARPPRVDESEAPAPSASQISVGTSASLPGVNLPASVSAPKLAAPVSKPVTGGTLLLRVPPIYPKTAIAEGIEGEVQLQGVIGVKGTVEKIRRVSGHPLLAQAAIEAVRHWRYDPYKVDGQPVTREATITLNFKIPR